MRFRHLMLVGCALASPGCAMKTTAPEVTPNLVAIPSPIPVMLGPVHAPKGELCAKTTGIRETCVEGFEQALKNGLWKVLLARTRVVERDGLVAEFRLVSFETGYGATTRRINLSMAWQFVLRDGSGRPVMGANETTFGPPMVNEFQLQGSVKALMQAVLERIGQALYDFNAAQLRSQAAMPAPALSCSPAKKRECMGMGACRGVQACLPDGSGYEPCDCGTGTKM